MQTVYVDLLFLINFSMDYLCMFLVSKLLFIKMSLIRAALGAVIGGIYSVALLFIPDGGIPEIIPNVICCVTMCLIVFFKKGDSYKRVIAISLTYMFASMLLGGIMTATFNLLNNSGMEFETSTSKDIPPWLVILVALSSILCTYVGGRFIRRRTERQTAHVTVFFGNRKAEFEAMYDSGNLLRDQISGRPVIVADESHAELLIDSPKELKTSRLTSLDKELAKRIVLIPYSTASGSRTMVAIRPQKLIITSQNRTYESDAILGFADVKCTLEDCSALIPYELI